MQLFTPSNKDDAAYNLITDLFIYGQNWMIIVVSLGVVCLRYRKTGPNRWEPHMLPWWVLLAVIGIYVPLNFFIIVLTWWPPLQQPAIPSWVTPGVATGIIVFGFFYWIVFAKIMPSLGFHIDSQPDELVDGSRIVTYKVSFALLSSFASSADGFGEAIQNGLRGRSVDMVAQIHDEKTAGVSLSARRFLFLFFFFSFFFFFPSPLLKPGWRGVGQVGSGGSGVRHFLTFSRLYPAAIDPYPPFCWPGVLFISKKKGIIFIYFLFLFSRGVALFGYCHMGWDLSFYSPHMDSEILFLYILIFTVGGNQPALLSSSGTQ